MATTDLQHQPPRGLSSGADVQAGVPRFALIRQQWLKSAAIWIAAALLLVLADIVLLRLHPGVYRVEVGNYRDKFFLDDANYQEVAPDGTTYRWSTGDSRLWLEQVALASPALFTLELGGRPQPGEVRLTLNEQPWVGFTAQTQPRHYTFLLPPGRPDRLAIGLHSATFEAPGDPRRLGVKVEGFALTLLQRALVLPTPAHYLAQLALIIAAQLTALRLGWRWRLQALLAGLLALALAVLLSSALLLAYAYLPRLAVAGAGLAALTWLVLPLAERRLTWLGGAREVRLLWALALLACAIRLTGTLYPTFGGQDLGLNLSRLIKTITGQLVVIAGSSEFANGQTIYPPGPYLAVMPGATLIGDLGSLLQGGLALLDGTTAFLVAMLARRLGGNRDAARFALVLYTANLAAFAALSFGFAAQVFGQWFTTPLALVLLAPQATERLRSWALAVLLLLFGIFAHIGVAILGVTWLGLILGLLLVRPRRVLGWAIGLLSGAGLLALALLYVDIAGITVSHAAGTLSQAGDGPLLRGATPLLVKGLRLAYTDAGLALLPLGLVLIARARPSLQGLAVPLAWLLTALLFLVVDLLLAMQVRYFYFALPLVLATVVVVLGQIAARGRVARIVAWVLVLALAVQGVALWYSTTMGDGAISMTPLTH